MSLQYDSRKSVPPLPDSKNDSALREVLIFGSITSGIPEITKENWHEVYARLHLTEISCGAFRTMVQDEGLVDVLLTPEDVRSWIGLSTNATPKTRPQFIKRFNYDLDNFVKVAKEIDKEVTHDVETKDATAGE